MGLRRPVVVVEHHHSEHHAAGHHHHDAVEVCAWNIAGVKTLYILFCFLTDQGNCVGGVWHRVRHLIEEHSQ